MNRRATWWTGASLCLLWLASIGAPAQSSPVVDPSKLVIDTASLPLGAPGHAYRFPLHASGGIPPMRWELVRGDLPGGMTLGRMEFWWVRRERPGSGALRLA